MTDRRIVVIYRKSLLAQGLEALLKRTAGLEVVGMDFEREDAAQHIAVFHPEAVIVDVDELGIVGKTLIMQVLQENPSVKVFCLSINGNNVDVYQRRQMAVTKADELVEAIRRG